MTMVVALSCESAERWDMSPSAGEVDRHSPEGVGASISSSMHAEVSKENAVRRGTDKGKIESMLN